MDVYQPLADKVLVNLKYNSIVSLVLHLHIFQNIMDFKCKYFRKRIIVQFKPIQKSMLSQYNAPRKNKNKFMRNLKISSKISNKYLKNRQRYSGSQSSSI